jgi:hypothetical protein
MAMSGQLHAPAALLPQRELPELIGGWFAALSVIELVLNNVSCVYFNTVAAFLTALFRDHNALPVCVIPDTCLAHHNPMYVLSFYLRH